MARKLTGSSLRLLSWWAPASPSAKWTASPSSRSRSPRGPKRRPAAQDDHDLLVGKVEAVGVRRFAAGRLEETAADQLAAELVTNARASRAKPFRSLARLEAGLVDVRHEGSQP